MADIRTTKGDMEGGNTPVDYQETDPSYFETNEVDGGLEISKFTTKEINHVVIPTEINEKKVVSIGENAFFDCTSLTSVVIPNSVTSIGDFAFDGCTGLTSIELPNSVTSIGVRAFNGCKGLRSIVIPKSVKSIGERAFEGCSKLTIYCKAKREPLFGWSWNWNWNPSKCPVVWGHKEN